MMNVLVINAGSSTLKYQLIDMENERVLAKGVCDKIGKDSSISHRVGDRKVAYEKAFPTHTEAFHEVCHQLVEGEAAVLSGLDQLAAVGHRVVHGGSFFRDSVLIDDDVLEKILSITDLAPLHNPPMVKAVRSCQEVLPSSVPQVAVFDTAFHHSLPEKAYAYPIPHQYRSELKIRRYGFHGTSHRFVSGQLAKALGRPITELKIATCHLGNGSTVTAVRHGQSVDTSAGFSTLDGVMMGTRCGAIDPSIPAYLAAKGGLSSEEIEDILMKQSGLLGASELSSDHRELEQAAAGGSDRAQLALDMYAYQIKKYIGAYAVAMGGLDGIVFTGGIGENSCDLRADVCEGMDFLGVRLDAKTNSATRSRLQEISTPDSRVRVFVIPTNEELLIARDTCAVIGK